MKRILLFVATNIAVIAVMSIVLSVLGVDRFMTQSGLNLPMLMVFSLVVGFTGSIISLLISKPMAKWSTGARVINSPSSSTELWLVDTVRKLSDRAGIGMPEVAVYDGEPNAFATGAFRNSALVAVSTGLLQSMTKEEVEAVLAHEVAHVANGDMITLSLIQGVVNTFVMFFARIIGDFVDRVLLKNENGRGFGFMITTIIAELVLGFLASMIVAAFSRYREYRADVAGATLADRGAMIRALQRLQAEVSAGVESPLPSSMRAFGISGGVRNLFASHPPLEDRIQALRNSASY